MEPPVNLNKVDATMGKPNVLLFNGVAIDAPCYYDRGFAYGDGLFETILCRQARYPLLSYHLERLSLGCERLGIPIDRDILSNALNDNLRLIKKSDSHDGTAKVVVTRGFGGEGCYPPDDANSNIYVSFNAQAKRDDSGTPKQLILASQRLPENPALAGLKHLNRLVYILGCQNLARSTEEVLFCDTSGRVVETMHHNIFFVDGGIVYTPRLNVCGVAGIMRKIVMEKLSPPSGIKVQEAEVSLADIAQFDEVFISNALKGIQSVSRIHESTFKSFDVCTELTSNYDKLLTSL
ncbi:MAG: 4-amino-4-deoxychorismate lyase [Lentisphaeria bacterium]|jgi:4-amino-4-deoxychorismate lyase